MRKLIIGVTIGLLLAGCGSNPSTGASADTGEPTQAVSTTATETATTQAPTSAAPQPPLDLTGKWKQVNSKADDSWFEAVIDGTTVEVHLFADSGDTKSLYWAGTYVAPTEPGDAFEWESQNDRSKTDGSILGSGSDTKLFTYADGELSWEFSMMGTTSIIRAERV